VGGLYQVTNGVITNHWDSYNSPLQSVSITPSDTTKYTTVSGLFFDPVGNLWITNSKVSSPLKVLKKDNTWQSFTLSPYNSGSAESVSEHLIIDSRNYKWITIPRHNKLIVFNDNRTIDDKSDDEIAQIDLNSSANIQTSQINCIVEDLNGNIWIGNNVSIKVVYNPGSAFSKQLYAKNILLEQNGYVQNLFEFESVTAIAVDGANRKWVGTSKAGVFLISANGTEQILHFNENNSPLLANQITSITIDQESGEVYFGTTAGIISYRGTATAGAKNYEDYLVFPNPVRETYSGPITVKGLMENSFCKIVDNAGLLVWQGYSYGGQLVWNGLDFNGKKPATGVYFVFASSDTGEEKQVAKLLFIK
jgi:ligand-binding sensor domain-containing protein